MKTSELRKVVEEHGYEFEKTEKFIYIYYIGVKAMTLDLRDKSITVDKNTILVTQSIKTIMVALIEYSLTPLNEREDEKKYYIHQPINNQYLNYDIKNKFYFMFEPTNTHDFKTIFTQQEIDNFPAEIKGAIECGFLRKVEVEWTK